MACWNKDTSDESNDQKGVNFQSRKSNVYSFCNIHTGKQCDKYCHVCDIPVCSKCILTTHGGHEFVALALENDQNRSPKVFDDLPNILCFAYEDIWNVADTLSSIEDIHAFFDKSGYAFIKKIREDFHECFDEFKRKIKSMQSRVILVKSNDGYYSKNKEFVVCIDRVSVKPSGKTLLIEESDISLGKCEGCNYFPRIIAVSSSSVGIIDSKLHVYKEFQDIFENGNVKIHHEFDSSKELLAYCVKHEIDQMKRYTKKVIENNSVCVDPGTVFPASNIAFSEEKIGESCQNIEITSDGIYIGSVRDGKYMCRFPRKIQRIKRTLISETLDTVIKFLVREMMHSSDIRTEDSSISYILLQLLHTITESIATEDVKTIALLQPVDVNSNQWRLEVANEIYKSILLKKNEITNTVCKVIIEHGQTIKELREIKEKLTKISKWLCFEQNKLIDEWRLREFRIKNIEECPSILHFIAGRKNGQIVMKVFLRHSDSKSKEFCFENAVNKPYNAVFDFIDVSEIKTIDAREGKETCISSDTKRRIKEIMQDKKEKLFAKYSTLSSISMSPVKYSEDHVIHEACIVLYCLDADLIPFGEEPLPKSLEEFECKILEDFIQFGRCENCQTLDHGCSVGRYGECSSGSLGFFAKKRLFPSIKGFLTAAHVALKDDVIADLNERKLSDCSSQNPIYKIVHPSFEDSATNNIIGHVEDSFFGNYNSSGIDAAFVKTDELQKEMYDSSFTFDIDSDEEYDVVKKGRTTGETKGLLKDCTFAIRKPFPDRAGIYLILDNCYSIYDSNSQIFFLPGDSGAAVYVINKSDGSLQPLGLAFGRMKNSPITFACPIEKVAEVLNLSILQPAEPMDIP